MLAAFAGLLLGTTSFAQETPRAEIAVGYSRLFLPKGFTLTLNGGNVTSAFNVNDWLGIAGDFGAYDGSSGIPGLISETYTFGPRFSYRKWDRFTPFPSRSLGEGTPILRTVAFWARGMHLPSGPAWVVTLGSIVRVSSHCACNSNFSTFVRTTTSLQIPTRAPSASRQASSSESDGDSTVEKRELRVNGIVTFSRFS